MHERSTSTIQCVEARPASLQLARLAGCATTSLYAKQPRNTYSLKILLWRRPRCVEVSAQPAASSNEQ
eukprot:3469097-Amphidinium_carterae.1